jgi:hypothetical protein
MATDFGGGGRVRVRAGKICPATILASLLVALSSCTGASRETTGSSGPTPFAGDAAIPNDTRGSSVDPQAATVLDGMSMKEILAFREERVAALSKLGLFPLPYAPLSGPARAIYSRITAGQRWLGPTSYYVVNPYVLVVLACANHVTPLNLLCPDVDIHYSNRRIEERRQGTSASCWLRTVHDPERHRPGRVRIVMVNAYDAGYHYAHVDLGLSLNVAPSTDAANIVNGLFRQSSFFHVGRYRVNNISPADRLGWVLIASPEAATRIHVKLWRDRPPSPEAAPDLTYVASVDPGPDEGTR